MTRWTRNLVRIVACGLLLGAGLMSVSAEEPVEPTAPAAPVKEIKMYAENWKWTPSLIRVKLGTTVRIHVENTEATHIFQLKAFGVKEKLTQDTNVTFEFVADRVGKFSWRCARPCGDGCPKMNGKLIVEE